MRLKIISVGRETADPVSPLVADYRSRVAKFVPVDDVVLKPDHPDRIAARMIKEARKAAVLIALDEGGKEVTSRGFADMIAVWMNDAVREVAFLIGGAEGLPPEVKKRADIQLALSRMTLPHRLARLVLIEQIYRSLCIVRGVPYQK